jgi:signal transduction histidine kinase
VARDEFGGRVPARGALGGLAALVGLAGVIVAVAFDHAGAASTADAIAAALAVGVVAMVGVVVSSVVPDNHVGWLLIAGAAAGGVGSGLTEAGVYGVVTSPGSVPGANWLAAVGPPVRGAGWLTLVVAVPALFPDGHLPGRRWRRFGVLVGAAVGLPVVASLLQEDAGENRLTGRFTSPLAGPAPVADALPVLAVLCVVVAIIGAVTGLVVRWRRDGAEVRQQVTLLALAACPPALLLPLAVLVPAVPSWTFAVAVLPLPLAIAVAVLTHGLYDLRRAASRGTVWLLMTVVVAVIYAAVVVAASALAQDRRSWWPPALAATAAALLVVPIRDRLQRRVNRAVYGRALEPYEVLTALGAQLDGVADPSRVIADTAGQIATELELDDLAVRRADGSLLLGGASPGGAPPTVVELRAFAGPVGSLEFRSPGRHLSARERQLIDDLARHLGHALHALTLREAVQTARERLVVAREEERRRLRRDLHDGIGPTLAALTLRVRTATTVLPDDAERARLQLTEIGEQIRRTVTEVRRLVEGLRPPALDELGLVAASTQALQALARDCGLTLTVEVDQELPALPAAIEVAAYRIALEAVTNVVRHARATTCRVRFSCMDTTLSIEIEDDGTGILEPRRIGTGLDSMSERAQELGGELSLTSDAGVTVRAYLPLPASPPGPA